MDLAFTKEDEKFRHEVREFIDKNFPQKLRDIDKRTDLTREDMLSWHKVLYNKGWIAPHWPKEYGGTDWNITQRYIWDQECANAGTTPLIPFGLTMLGPVIIGFGNDEQKDWVLKGILSGDDWWCQGYSEPGAGSDLASLRTKAERVDDHYIVNGHKIWTTLAQFADWMFCLVRTNSDVGKHSGISLVLFDMETPGVSTKPIKLISGTSVFCETYLDNVRVDIEQVVGDIDAGWTVAKYLLTHEREMLGKLGTAPTEKSVKEHALDCLGVCNDRLADEVMRKELIDWEIDYLCHQLTMERVNAEIASNGVGNTSAMLKYYGTELNKRKHELLVSIHGSDSMHWENNPISRQWLRSKGNSIEGGTSEIQLNIISKRILGLG